MKIVKTVLVFVLGVMAGGLIFGFQGPAPSLAGGSLPTDLFYLSNNYPNKQYYCIKTGKYPNYKVTSVTTTASGNCMVGYIGEK